MVHKKLTKLINNSIIHNDHSLGIKTYAGLVNNRINSSNCYLMKDKSALIIFNHISGNYDISYKSIDIIMYNLFKYQNGMLFGNLLTYNDYDKILHEAIKKDNLKLYLNMIKYASLTYHTDYTDYNDYTDKMNYANYTDDIDHINLVIGKNTELFIDHNKFYNNIVNLEYHYLKYFTNFTTLTKFGDKYNFDHQAIQSLCNDFNRLLGELIHRRNLSLFNFIFDKIKDSDFIKIIYPRYMFDVLCPNTDECNSNHYILNCLFSGLDGFYIRILYCSIEYCVDIGNYDDLNKSINIFERLLNIFDFSNIVKKAEKMKHPAELCFTFLSLYSYCKQYRSGKYLLKAYSILNKLVNYNGYFTDILIEIVSDFNEYPCYINTSDTNEINDILFHNIYMHCKLYDSTITKYTKIVPNMITKNKLGNYNLIPSGFDIKHYAKLIHNCNRITNIVTNQINNGNKYIMINLYRIMTTLYILKKINDNMINILPNEIIDEIIFSCYCEYMTNIFHYQIL